MCQLLIRYVSFILFQQQAFANFWMVDKDGLLGQGRSNVHTAQLRYVRHDVPDKLPLLEVIKIVRLLLSLFHFHTHSLFFFLFICFLWALRLHLNLLSNLLNNLQNVSDCLQ